VQNELQSHSAGDSGIQYCTREFHAYAPLAGIKGHSRISVFELDHIELLAVTPGKALARIRHSLLTSAAISALSQLRA
jgi:hypothetical protein